MQIEKKLIACSILAIAIGIATIIPLEYFMSIEGAQAAPDDKPWFGVSVPYVYVNPFKNDNSALIQGVGNFTFTPEGLALNDAEAKIEYYQFHIYSEQGSILNVSYSMAISKIDYNATGYPGGVYSAITGSGANTFSFANGLVYNGIKDYKGDCFGGGVFYTIPEGMTFSNQVFSDYIQIGETSSALPFPNSNGTVMTNQYSEKDNNAQLVVNQLRNAQNLYIDVSRICTIIYNGNITINNPSNPVVLQHIELTKTPNNAFVYGTYVQGSVPFPMETQP